MATDASIPDPAVVLDLLEAFRRSKTMFAACSLGVFDALQASPLNLQSLAKKYLPAKMALNDYWMPVSG